MSLGNRSPLLPPPVGSVSVSADPRTTHSLKKNIGPASGNDHPFGQKYNSFFLFYFFFQKIQRIYRADWERPVQERNLEPKHLVDQFGKSNEIVSSGFTNSEKARSGRCGKVSQKL